MSAEKKKASITPKFTVKRRSGENSNVKAQSGFSLIKKIRFVLCNFLIKRLFILLREANRIC
jgi:hypothetical protein